MSGILHWRFAETLGWALLHSLWQLAVIAGAWAAGLALLRRAAASVRHAAACAGLAAMLAAPVATFYLVLPAAPPPAQMDRMPGEVLLTPARAAAMDMPPASAAPAMPEAPLPLAARLRQAVTPWISTAAACYLIGAGIMLARLAAGYAQLRGIIGAATALEGAAAARLRALSRRMGVGRAVRLLESAAIEVPTLIGSLKPVILLPASALTGLSADQLSALLAHELAHIRRHDYAVNLAQSLIDTLLFYHPAAWWLSARIRQERELCCDDAAIAATENRLEYAQALAAMESLRSPGPTALAARGGGGSLLWRIGRILDMPAPARRPHRIVSTASAAVLVMVVAALVYIGCNKSPAPSAAASSSATNTSLASLPANSMEHTYDIRYILGAKAGTDATAAQAASKELLDAIQSSVVPGSWRAAGGSGDLRIADGRLTVTQSPENLLAVDRFLEHRFETRAMAIAFEYRALVVSSDFLDDFRIGWDLQLPVSGTGQSVLKNASIIDYWTLNLLLSRTQSDARYYSAVGPRVTTPDGFPAHLGADLPAAHPATGMAAGIPAFPALTALSVDVTPQMSADRHYIVCSFGDFKTSEEPVAATASAAEHDAPRTMVTIPDGGTLVIDGGPVKALTAQGAQTMRLLILVRTNMLASMDEGENLTFERAGGITKGPFDTTTQLAPPTSQPATMANAQTKFKPGEVLIKAMLVEADADAWQKAGGTTQPNQAGLDEKDLAKRIADLVAAKQAEILARPYILLNNGQSGSIHIGQQINYIKGVHNDPEKGRVVDIDTLFTGIQLNVQANASPESGLITLDFDASLSALLKMDAAPDPEAKPGEPPVQTPVLDRRQTNAKVSVENGKTMVLEMQPAKPGKVDLLFLTPQVARDVESLKALETMPTGAH